jgi:hypothetical protein
MNQGNTGTTRTGIFPTRAEFDAAVATIPTTKAKWQGEEGPRFRLEFSPGSVRVTSTDLGRANRTENDRVAAHLRKDADMLLAELNAPPTRGEIKEWSAKSRARMALRLATLDYQPMFAGGGRAAMVTLTMPFYWEPFAPDAVAFKAMVNRFRNRYKDSWGDRVDQMPGVWKMEFQDRRVWVVDPKAPHLHIVTVPPKGVREAPLSIDDGVHLLGCADDCAESHEHVVACPGCDVEHDELRPVGVCGNCHAGAHTGQFEFAEWLSRTWNYVVYRDGLQGPVPAGVVGWDDERRKHQRAGTGVDYQEVENYSDPKRIGAYFAKHGSYFDKEYQNHAPELWKAAGAVGARFWGYWVVRPLIVSKETHEALIMHIVHHLRHLADASSYSRKTRTVKGHTLPFDPATGECTPTYFQPRTRKRPVARRVKRFRNRNGYGFLVLNDGLSTVADIARIISALVNDEENRQTRLGYDLSSGVDGDWFGTAPDHAPRSVLALDRDFHREGSAEADELTRAKLDHARRRRLGFNRLGEPLPPIESGVESELDVFGFHGGSLPQFLSDMQTGELVFDEVTWAARQRALQVVNGS